MFKVQRSRKCLAMRAFARSWAPKQYNDGLGAQSSRVGLGAVGDGFHSVGAVLQPRNRSPDLYPEGRNMVAYSDYGSARVNFQAGDKTSFLVGEQLITAAMLGQRSRHCPPKLMTRQWGHTVDCAARFHDAACDWTNPALQEFSRLLYGHRVYIHGLT